MVRIRQFSELEGVKQVQSMTSATARQFSSTKNKLPRAGQMFGFYFSRENWIGSARQAEAKQPNNIIYHDFLPSLRMGS